MKEWLRVTGSQADRPKEIDTDSSPTTVYLRRGIKEIEISMDAGEEQANTIKEWEYEERELTREEYAQSLIVKENTQGIVEAVTEFNKESAIDEYTMQLIEEGVL